MCGIFGIYNHPEASKLAYLGLYALQHRGQESAGIASADSAEIYSELGMGLVADIFNSDKLSHLTGPSAIGHVRYSTTGQSIYKNAQPLVINYSGGKIALAHNGNIVNSHKWRKELEDQGSIFQTNSDSEIILHILAKVGARMGLKNAMKHALSRVKGTYSIVALTQNCLIAARDPWGVRPLCLGRIGKTWVAASETCAFDLIDAQYVREVNPGEMVIIDSSGLHSCQVHAAENNLAKCVFEFIYFSRPDSMIFNENVHIVRRQMGRYLAMESPNQVRNSDLVIAVPDSANSAAIGYSQASGIPFETGLIRNHYIGRTFIEPDQKIRDFGAKIKYNPIKSLLDGKKVVIVDDSIVRGTTMKKLVKMIRNAGALEVHLAISSPPIIGSCFYGIDTPQKKDLIAANHSVESITKFLGVNTLQYLSLKSLLKAVGSEKEDFCTACFTDKYKIKCGGCGGLK